MAKKIILTAILSVVAFNGYSGVILAASQDDLCGGTGGNGEIVSVGSNTFTLKLNDGGKKGSDNLIVNLTPRTAIETLAGLKSLADLKIGNRVTLVGSDNGDGTFDADAIVVCSGTQEGAIQENETGSTSPSTMSSGLNGSPQADQASPIAVRNKNPEAYAKVSSTIHRTTMALVSLIWLGISAFFLLKKKKSFVYVLFFTIFYIYLYKVLDYTLLQFQSLLLIQHFVPDLMLNGFRDGTNVNLMPLSTLKLEDITTSLLNILMMMPFGFGLPFITRFRFKKVAAAGLLLSIVIELLQFATGFLANTTFRIADINDVIFNTLGVTIGYLLFVQFMFAFRRFFPNKNMLSNPLFRYISKRPQIGE